MDVAIYVRVSTDKQELENQLSQLRLYCRTKQYNIIKVYEDIITGGAISRPGFDMLLNDARIGYFQHLIFWSLDRLSRSGTLFTLQCLKEFENRNITWESFQEQYLNSIGPFKDVVLSVLSTIAKIEKERISERTKAGLETAKAKGKTLGRPKGSKDTKKRNRAKYIQNYHTNKNHPLKKLNKKLIDKKD